MCLKYFTLVKGEGSKYLIKCLRFYSATLFMPLNPPFFQIKYLSSLHFIFQGKLRFKTARLWSEGWKIPPFFSTWVELHYPIQHLAVSLCACSWHSWFSSSSLFRKDDCDGRQQWGCSPYTSIPVHAHTNWAQTPHVESLQSCTNILPVRCSGEREWGWKKDALTLVPVLLLWKSAEIHGWYHIVHV